MIEVHSLFYSLVRLPSLSERDVDTFSTLSQSITAYDIRSENTMYAKISIGEHNHT